MQVLAPLPIGFAVFMVHLATILVTGTGINPARSFNLAIIFNNEKTWDDQVRDTCTYFILVFCVNFYVTKNNDQTVIYVRIICLCNML